MPPFRLLSDVGNPVRALAIVAGIVIVVTVVAGADPRPRPTPSRPLSPFGLTTAASTESDSEDSPQPPDCPPWSPSNVGAVDLPWAVTLATSCGRFTVFPGGQVEPAPLPFQPLWHLSAAAGPGAWADVKDSHVVLALMGHVVWRSKHSYDEQSLGSALLGPGWVAFTIFSQGGGFSDLYVASLGAEERKVGFNEEPLLATMSSAFLASRWRPDGSHPDLVLLRSDGTILRVVAPRVRFMTVDQATGTVLFVGRGSLWRTDGLRTSLLMTRTMLGLRKTTSLDMMDDGRILMTDPDRVMVLDQGGTLLARAGLAPIPRGGWGYAWVWPAGRVGKLVVTQVWWRDSGMGGGPGWEGVYVLDRGTDRFRLVYGKRLRIAVCAHSSGVSWHGSWLLYYASEGRAVAIDITGRHGPVDLRAVVRQLPMPTDQRQYGLSGAKWASVRSPAELAAKPQIA